MGVTVVKIGGEVPAGPLGVDVAALTATGARVVVVHGDLGHQSVEGQHARMVGHHQSRAGLGEVLDPADLRPEPRPEEHSQQRKDDCFVEVRVEPELVDAVVTGHPLADEVGDRGNVLGQLGRRRLDTVGPVCVDVADDGVEFLVGDVAIGIGEKRGMAPRTFRTLRRAASLSRAATRIRVQRNDFRFRLAGQPGNPLHQPPPADNLKVESSAPSAAPQ